MADLICVAFEDPTTADRVLTGLTALQKEFVIQLKDACVVLQIDRARELRRDELVLTRLAPTKSANLLSRNPVRSDVGTVIASVS